MSALLELERRLMEAQRDARYHAMKHKEVIDRVASAFHGIEHDRARKLISTLAAEVKKLHSLKGGRK